MEWTISESGLVGPVDFSTDAIGLRTVLGEPTATFKRTTFSDQLIYAYDNVGLHLALDAKGIVFQLIIFPPNEVNMGGVRLLGRAIEIVYRELIEAGIILAREEAGLWSEAHKVLLVEIEGVVDGVELNPS